MRKSGMNVDDWKNNCLKNNMKVERSIPRDMFYYERDSIINNQAVEMIFDKIWYQHSYIRTPEFEEPTKI